MPVPRALQILEVLENILSHCADETNQQSVLVCKLWSEVALDVLWYKVEDLERFLRLFGELEEEEDDETFLYSKMPSVATWQRFEKVYQHRIRILSLCKPHTKYTPALITISRIRSEGPLLPKLHTLEWYGLSGSGLAEPSVMFMHNGIRKFRIDDDGLLTRIETNDNITSYCTAINTRMPRLSTLDLCLVPSPTYQRPIIALIQQLPDLEDLSIPAFEDQTIVLIGLRDMPILSLSLIQMVESLRQETSSILNGPHQRTGFSKLREVEFCCTLAFATLLFQNITVPNNMRSVILCSKGLESSHDIRTLISEIVASFSRLTTLRLDNLEDVEIPDGLPSQPLGDDTIHLEDISPLLNRYPDMRCFMLRSPYPLALDDNDMETIAKSWPQLKYLWLCDQPCVLFPEREKRITLNALSHLSRHCPCLSVVGLYLDATSDHIPNFASVKLFENLTQLEFGPSSIDRSALVARTLAQVCLNHNLKLMFGSEWKDPEKISPILTLCGKLSGKASRRPLE
ncbi:hypothetical protein BT96DRAFT_1020341 [Gymnopus androsaceus JB14]|uniref:F-box domain-containing protein n=1 Tax=Gymnopus androsaceus JB14 TaxID=1447944 RepID=A0A6A4HJH7_9AGAR|nr:hypothetical protein BT96DRAFT_1020341 [Gymnopus androsaceus JB14]